MSEIVNMCIRIPAKDYKLLRKLKYLREKSLNSLIVDAIKQSIEKEKKMLINADVVIS